MYTSTLSHLDTSEGIVTLLLTRTRAGAEIEQ